MNIDDSTPSASLSVTASPDQLRELRAHVRAVAYYYVVSADDLADLVLAVDEAASALLGHAVPLGVLTCTFAVDPDRALRVNLTATTTEPVDNSATSFRWFVLHMLVDVVTLDQNRALDEDRWDVSITLVKMLHT